MICYAKTHFLNLKNLCREHPLTQLITLEYEFLKKPRTDLSDLVLAHTA